MSSRSEQAAAKSKRAVARARRRRSCWAPGSATSPAAEGCGLDPLRRHSALAGGERHRPRGTPGRRHAGGKRVAALSGRAHFYEGHDLRTVTFATRVMGRLGVKILILTNAAGGINAASRRGC